MRRSLFLCAFAVTFSFFGAVRVDGGLTDGLAGYWPLDEGSGSVAWDASGNENDGQVIGASWVSGCIGEALHFDGGDDYVRVSHDSALTFDDELTVCLWIRVASHPSSERIFITKTDYASGAWYGFDIRLQTGGKLRLVSNAQSTSLTTPYGLPEGEWSHVALRIGGGRCAFYLDGAPWASVSARSSYRIHNTRDLILGAYQPGKSTLHGELDDVRIYNRALTDAEILKAWGFPHAGDTTRPSAPGNLTASLIFPNYVALSWQASTDNQAVYGYRIYRDGAFLETAETTSDEDKAVSGPAAYTYAVRAVDTAGNESGASNPVTIDVPVREPDEVTQLKDLRLTTHFVQSGVAEAVIVVPAGGRYDTQANAIQSALSAGTGVSVPIRTDAQVSPAGLLAAKNVIALGNMATSTFIETLYQQWYTLLDLRYPGAGGYVLRSVHNPLGTGRNVVLVGGSDDAGVSAAADALVVRLGTDAYKIGWTMQIALPPGTELPTISKDTHTGSWGVYSWRDSWREYEPGKTVGYGRASSFGWNEISVSGALYYMTGRPEYLDVFKQLAMPDPADIPGALLNNSAFRDAANPLVDTYHYHTHLVDLVYDLIEESPLFTDAERLHITNKLIDHQYFYNATHDYVRYHTDRHGLWHSICIYTGSRYLSRSYPHPVWEHRMANSREGLRSKLGDADWGERDTLYWMSTGGEPLFDFFMLDGFDEFVSTGTAESIMTTMMAMMTGAKVDDYNQCMTINMLLKAAYMLKDGNYVWMLNQLGFDLDRFRIGQSWWPPADLAAVAPTQLVDSVTVAPLPRHEWEWAGETVPFEEAFQLLSYRSGLGVTDDFLQIDGFQGLGRNPHHLSTLYLLRMFGGKTVLNGYANDLDIWRNGFCTPRVARSSALENKLARAGFAYINVAVPDEPGSRWDRHVLYRKGRAVVVVDRVEAIEDGNFDIDCAWALGADVQDEQDNGRRLMLSNGIVLTLADGLNVSASEGSKSVVQRVVEDLAAGQTVVIGNAFSATSDEYGLHELAGTQRAYLLTGDEAALLGVDRWAGTELEIDAEYFFLDDGNVLLAEATRFELGGAVILSAPTPVSCLWAAGRPPMLRARAAAVDVTLAKDGGGTVVIHVPADRAWHTASAALVASLNTDAAAAVEALRNDTVEPPPPGAGDPAPPENWHAVWQRDLGGKVHHVGFGVTEDPLVAWAGVNHEAGSSDLVRVSRLGAPTTVASSSSEMLSMWPARNAAQRVAFSVLAGYRDDMLRAYSPDAELWNAKTEIDPSFWMDGWYNAAWFSDPRPPHNRTGVHSILVDDLWGTGEQIAVGRACTVEFHPLTGGGRLGRTATTWGDNTSLGVVKTANVTGGSWVLAGKLWTGSPGLSVIDRDYNNRSDGQYASLWSSYTGMHAWLQRGLSHMAVADVDGDGDEEVVYLLTGHWNELRMYDGYSCGLKWAKYFGPDHAPGADCSPDNRGFMRALKVLDLDGDGEQEILVGTQRGTAIAFNYDGSVQWQTKLDASIRAFAAVTDYTGATCLAVGLSDGHVLVLDASAAEVFRARLPGSIASMSGHGTKLVCGADDGTLAWFDLTPNLNYEPLAVDDTAVVAAEQPTMLDVLANDTDANGDPLTVSSVGVAAHGTAINMGTHILYRAPAGYMGPDTFTYRASDGQADSAAATVSLTVGIVDPGLAGYWPLNEGTGTEAADVSPHANHGAVLGATWTAGISGNALHFDGGDDYVRVPHDSAFTFGDELTVCLWIRVASHPSSERIFITKTDYADGAWYGFDIRLGTDGRLRLVSNAQSTSLTTPSGLPEGDWAHVALRIGGGRCAFYLDGAPWASVAARSSYRIHNTRELILGAYQPGKSTLLGELDDVRIYDRALTDAEIYVVAGAGSDPDPDDDGVPSDVDADQVADLKVRVGAGADDAEERLDSGAVSLTSSDLELVRDSADQLVGMRFAGVTIPAAAQIEYAWLELTTDESSTEPTTLTIQGQATDNAAGFAATAGNVSVRPRTTASVSWAPGEWHTIGRVRQSPNIAAVIQEIVDRPGWQSGNALVVLVGGSGRRVADSYDGDHSTAPQLCVAFHQAPGIAVSSTDLSVSAVQGQDAADVAFQVWNELAGTLAYSVVESTSKFSVAPGSGTSAGTSDKRTHTISFTTANLNAGTYDRSLQVADAGSGARNSPVTIQVHIRIEPPPDPPSGFTATPLYGSAVRLRWTDLPDETEYMLRRSLDGEYWYAVSAVYPPADTTEYTVTGLDPDTTYYFKIRGIRDGAYGAYCEPVPATTPRAEAGTFTAYNDLGWDASQPAGNITVLSSGQAGLLMDHGTGQLVPVTLSVAGGGTVSTGADAADGTDGADAFSGIVDCRGLIQYAQAELILTLAGLDEAQRYELTLFGNRAVSSYGGRTTTVVLEGADAFQNRSSAGATVATTTQTDDTTTIVNGFNTANGFVARYDQIEPGSDGEIRVRVPAWDGIGDAGRYYLNAVRLRGVEPPAPTLARGSVWRYRKGTAEASDPGTAWRQPAFDDSGWAAGVAPIGYGTTAAGGTILDDMRYNYTSIFLRRMLDVQDPSLVSAVEMQIDYDDGFILWINGTEIARTNAPGTPGTFVPCDATANANENATLTVSLSGAQIPELVVGANVIAAQVFNRSLTVSSDCRFDAEVAVVIGGWSRTADADQSNLPDAWEALHLSDLTDPTDRTDLGDPDGDGLSNLQEWIAGSDPRSEIGNLKFEIRGSAGGVEVSFPTIVASGPGYEGMTRCYALEERAGLGEGSAWQIVPGYESIVGAGQTVEYLNSSGAFRAYRARVWLVGE